LNAIDPGVILAPDGTLWICYGSYHGSIRVTQLDPHTGLALAPKTLGARIRRRLLVDLAQHPAGIAARRRMQQHSGFAPAPMIAHPMH
jgi:hypothetical protein